MQAEASAILHTQMFKPIKATVYSISLGDKTSDSLNWFKPDFMGILFTA